MPDQPKDKPEPRQRPGRAEFVALMAVTMGMVAFSVDSMLPAFPEIARDLRVTEANDIQLVISLLFTGMAIGQLFYGSLSDTIGRKPAIYIGFGLFILGSVLSLVATDFNLMLAGRLLQGIGAAGPRTVSVALIRDLYRGSQMAQVMSFIMTVFILVPIFAPAIGQLVVFAAGWRTIFAGLIVLAFVTFGWLGLRQPETLPRSRRMPFSLQKLKGALRDVLTNRVAMVAMLIAGCVSGSFLGYLSLSQQIFAQQYGLGGQFPLYFAIMAIAVGCASLINGGFVMRFGMHRLSDMALTSMMLLSCLLALVVWLYAGRPPLWLFVAICLALFFAIGVLFGNLNSIAMEPLGHVAGTAAAVIGSISTLIAVVLGFLIGQAYDGTLYSLAAGFVVLGTISKFLILSVKASWGENGKPIQ